MWSSVPSHESLTRPRVAIAALVSSLAVVSSIYYIYRWSHSESEEFVYTGGLHRSNAVRRTRRNSHRDGATSPQPSTSSSQDQNETPDGADGADGADDDDGPPDLDTIIDDEGRSVGAWFDEPPPQRVGHNIVNLLFRVSEDNSRRNASIHRGCQCNVCGTAPIRGIRYRCANCADFDLCESCESQGLHIKTHVFYKVKVPAPPPGLRQMQPVWYTGDPDSVNKSLPRSLILKLARETGFERPELEACWEQWTFMANTEWRDDPDGLHLAMDRKTFERCLITSGGSRHTAPNLLHDRMFAFYDTNKDGLIGFKEFLHALSYRQRPDRLRKVFEGYDIDGDGYIDRKDCLRMFRAYYVLYKQMHKDVLDGLDEQGMSSTEVQQLATGRQPISSLFGRELHRMPSADPVPDTLHGKTRHPNGQVDLAPGRSSVVRESKGDVASRRQILTRLFWGSLLDQEDFLAPAQYAEALLGPLNGVPAIEELLSTLESMASDPAPMEVLQAASSGEDAGTSQSPTPEGEREGDDLEQENNTSAEGRSSSQEELEESSRNEDSTTERPATTGGFHVSHNDGRLRVTIPERRLSPSRERAIKKDVRRRLYERWLRRQFYLDEEEGAKAPREWKEEHDVLSRAMTELENAKQNAREDDEGVPSRLSPRSRSSSKVRFATDGDDLETRSNHSSASRTVPERWGGMDIPDAEHDAGKEVMYQIAQQAFNEMLDPLFKDREDFAVKLAETREERKRCARKIAAAFKDGQDGSGIPVGEEKKADTCQSGHDSDNIQEAGAEDTGDADEAYRDPTMPQFRPNSDVDALEPATSTLPNGTACRQLSSKAQGKRPATAEAEGDNEVIPFTVLNDYRNMNMEERKARERGGFGRLDYQEFERRYKEQESMGHRLDYLGSWIDFCIP